MDLQAQAIDFRHAYEVVNSPELIEMQFGLIREEYTEFRDAHYDEETENADTLKELADLVYVCFQYAENRDWDLHQALDRVHRSNMSKLGDDGHPIRRADGKILKGPNYQPPDLSDLV
tara:strand:- start:607 stop:960 length:354 start_codon:yes stop_codon:yes gene_type:complete